MLIFAYGLALVRLAGRRVIGKWAALDIIVSIMAASNLSRVITGSAPLVGTLAATALLMCSLPCSVLTRAMLMVCEDAR